MGNREDQKNNKLARKFSSHTINLLKLEPGTEEFRKERAKAIRAKLRFFNYIKKSTKK